ncbi:uncharacterized protein LOC134789071, partial [Penaeus indicus]|uniref:uncharacterized protein LOC134789071 n=1 Tax=Penaeus indicus TaxID=29960 RepID=UPI00300D8BFE
NVSLSSVQEGERPTRCTQGLATRSRLTLKPQTASTACSPQEMNAHSRPRGAGRCTPRGRALRGPLQGPTEALTAPTTAADTSSSRTCTHLREKRRSTRRSPMCTAASFPLRRRPPTTTKALPARPLPRRRFTEAALSTGRAGKRPRRCNRAAINTCALRLHSMAKSHKNRRDSPYTSFPVMPCGHLAPAHCPQPPPLPLGPRAPPPTTTSENSPRPSLYSAQLIPPPRPPPLSSPYPVQPPPPPTGDLRPRPSPPASPGARIRSAAVRASALRCSSVTEIRVETGRPRVSALSLVALTALTARLEDPRAEGSESSVTWAYLLLRPPPREARERPLHLERLRKAAPKATLYHALLYAARITYYAIAYTALVSLLEGKLVSLECVDIRLRERVRRAPWALQRPGRPWYWQG